MTQIGNNIKKIRKVKGLSQQAFAEVFNLTRGNISSYEELRAEPKTEIILQIAKYFSIPVAQLLEKQLTVNEILNFNDQFEDNSSSKMLKNFAPIPYVGREAFEDGQYIYKKIDTLPSIYFPGFSTDSFIAIENTHFVPKPTDFPFEENTILFFEKVRIEILHNLHKHYGLYMNEDELFFGKYKVDGKKISLILNDWKKTVFKPEHEQYFWVLYAKFERTT